MNEMTLDDGILKLTQSFAKPWGDALSRLLGTSCKVAIEAGTLSDPGAQPLCVGIAFKGRLVGDAALVIPTVDRQTLSIKSSEAPRDYAESALEAHDPALHEHLRQSLVAALKDFQAQHGPLIGRIDPCELPSWAPHKTLVLEVSSDDRPAVHAYLLCHQNLRVDNLAGERGVDNLDLVMNADLEVTLRFGQQSVTLAKLAALGPGSVIELDRKVEAPIDLVLGGKVLARGEVMIVDGNYGLRVTEVLDRSEL